MVATFDPEIILEKEPLEKYIDSLSKRGEHLRFPSKTSSSGSYGVCLIVWDEVRDVIVMLPYKHKTGKRKNPKNQEAENPEILSRICILSETGLDIDEEERIFQLGNPFLNENSDEFSIRKDFPKYTMLAKSFKGKIRNQNQVISEKNGPPVWIKRHLLKQIFEKSFISLMGKIHKHSQLYAYNNFCDYYNRMYRL